MAIHTLKIHPEPFAATMRGDKRFEYRRDDRMPRFDVNDVLVLREYDPQLSDYTNNEIRRKVTYILRGPAFEIPEGFCVMSLTGAT